MRIIIESTNVTKIYVTTEKAFARGLYAAVALPLEHGSVAYIKNEHLDYFIAAYKVCELPYLSKSSIGYYTPDLVYHSGYNYIVDLDNHLNWLKTQSALYEQRQLMDIL